ncbi:MAG: VanZ family protein [Marmoricola sp.]
MSGSPFTDLESAARRAQVLANIALTTPTGVLAAWTLTGKKLWSVVARFSLLPLVIELTQFTLPIGRVAATEDVILGALGILLGATAQRFTRAAFGSPPRE